MNVSDAAGRTASAVSRGELALVLAWMRAFAAEIGLAANQHEYDLAVLYDRLRSRAPDLYVELGRGQACSTLLAALAFAANGGGSIVSIDLNPLTSHDLLARLPAATGITVDLRVGDIRDLGADEWQALTAGSRDVAVFVDAHGATGAPIAEVLLPFAREHREIGWQLICHDVLCVEDRTLFDAFSGAYSKRYPLVSPYPEFRAIFPALAGLDVRHFSKLGTPPEGMLRALDVPVSMTPARAAKHRFVDGVDRADIAARFGLLARSATIVVDLPAGPTPIRPA
jgi:predicted O-methyltransferase YrrM